MQVLYLGRAPRTKETPPDFLKWRRVTRPPLVFRGLTGSQRTPGFWGVTVATPKDVYVMLIVDMLVDSIANNESLSYMDDFSGYNQILIAVEDIPKTAFRCPSSIETFEWLVMPFGLKNVGVTYQREMNAIFHDMIGHHMEVYIDDIVVKSRRASEHANH